MNAKRLFRALPAALLVLNCRTAHAGKVTNEEADMWQVGRQLWAGTAIRPAERRHAIAPN